MVKLNVDAILDKIHANDEEKQHIISVLNRDQELEHIERERLSSLKESLEELQVKANTSSTDPQICPLCSQTYWLFNSAQNCPRCGRTICEKCRLLSFNGSPCCILCTKTLVYYCKSGEWKNLKETDELITVNGIDTTHKKNILNPVIYSTVSKEKKKKPISTDDLLDDIKANLEQNDATSRMTFLEIIESHEYENSSPAAHLADDYRKADGNDSADQPKLDKRMMMLDVDEDDLLSSIEESSETEYEKEVTTKSEHRDVSRDPKQSSDVDPWLEFEDEEYNSIFDKYSSASSLNGNKAGILDTFDDLDDHEDLDTAITLLAVAEKKAMKGNVDLSQLVSNNERSFPSSPATKRVVKGEQKSKTNGASRASHGVNKKQNVLDKSVTDVRNDSSIHSIDSINSKGSEEKIKILPNTGPASTVVVVSDLKKKKVPTATLR